MNKFTIFISFFSFLFFSLLSNEVFAQNCTPDTTITAPGFYPETLDIVKVNDDYEQIIQVLAIKDTLVEFAGQKVIAIIDSIVLINVIGLPSGFDYVCNSTRCLFRHPEVGCVKLSGKANESQVGMFPLRFVVTTYGRVGLLRVPQTDTVDAYDLFISLDGKMDLKNKNKIENTLIIYPNPNSNGRVQILIKDEILNIKLTNKMGQEVKDFSFLEKDKMLDVSSLSSGVYTITITTAGGSYTQKLVLLNNQ